MVVALRSMNSIDKETMSLLILEPRCLFNIGAGDPLYSDVDAIVRKVKLNITDRIAKSFVSPMKLCRMYNSYVWLVKEDVNDYLENFMAAEPAPTFVEYGKELDRLNKAMLEISELSFKYENFNLVCVSTESIGDMLYNRAQELRDGLAQIIAAEARQTNIAIIDQYNAILLRIAEKPANEKQLADLRDFIESSKATVAELKKSVTENRRTLKLLETFNIPLSVEDMGLSWSTLEYPSKVEYSGKEVEIALEADKIRMMDRLALQKDQFEKLVEQLGQSVKAGTLLDDYSDREKIVEKVNIMSLHLKVL
jgi:dynein heavy chain